MAHESLVLIGASGLAREAIAAVEAIRSMRVVGVLDDDVTLHGSRVGGSPVLGGIDRAIYLDAAHFVVSVGSGIARRLIVDRLALLGIETERYSTIVHPSVTVPSSCSVRAGSILLANVTLTADVEVGEHVVLMPQVVLTHDNRIDEFATLCAGVALGGGVRIGSAAYLGMNASVRQNLNVGDGATLGMGSVLLRDLPDGQTWAGVPAGPVRGITVGGGTSGHQHGDSIDGSAVNSAERTAAR